MSDRGYIHPHLSTEARFDIGEGLKVLLPDGSAVYGGVTEVNRMGTVRHLKLFVAPPTVLGFRPAIVDLTYRVALCLDLPFDHKRGTIRVRGGGFDPRLHIVSLLAMSLYGREQALLTERLF
jgi:hypothetical protein